MPLAVCSIHRVVMCPGRPHSSSSCSRPVRLDGMISVLPAACNLQGFYPTHSWPERAASSPTAARIRPVRLDRHLRISSRRPPSSGLAKSRWANRACRRSRSDPAGVSLFLAATTPSGVERKTPGVARPGRFIAACYSPPAVPGGSRCVESWTAVICRLRVVGSTP